MNIGIAVRSFAEGHGLTYRSAVSAVQQVIIGRDSELAGVRRFLGEPSGSAGVLVVEGEPGIGKTSVWRAAVLAAADSFGLVVSSAPTEAEAGLPHSVLADLLEPLPADAFGTLSGPLRAALEVALFRQPPGPSSTDQLAVSTAFYRVLREMAADKGVLLAVDDIQWADAPSRRVIAFAMHRLGDAHVKLLASVRQPGGHEVLTALRQSVGDDRIRHVALGPLTIEAIDDLLLQRLERPLRPVELDRVYAASGGNPFFALEIGRFIIQHPASVRLGEPIQVPRSLADAVADRIQRLPRKTRESLVGLACLSRPDEKLLERANLVALDEAFNTHVLETSQGRLRFTHPLLASVIYSTAEPAIRRQWHARLASIVSDPEERARHLALASTGPDAEVAYALEVAAVSANTRGAPDAAAALAEQASQLTPGDLHQAIERRQILTAEYRLRAGDVPGARHLLDQVVGAAPGARRPAEALRLMGSLTLGGDDLAGAERLLTEALSQASDEREQAVIERDLIRILVQRGKVELASDHSTRLTEIASHIEDPAIVAMAQRARATTRRFFENLAPEVRATAIALAEDRLSVPIDDNTGGLHPLLEWAVLLKFADDFAHARALFKRSLALTEGRDESLRTGPLFHLAEMETWAGDLLLAAVYQHECEKSVMHTGHYTNARLSLNAKALIHCYRGELDAGRAAANEALALSASVGDVPYELRALGTLGTIELAAGDPVAANHLFDRLRRVTHPGYGGVVRSEGDEVEALIATGRLGEVHAVQQRLARFDYPWQRSIGSRCRALLASAHGDAESAIDHFETAISEHAYLTMPLERARTLLGYGMVLRRVKRKRAARERLEEALSIFASLGAGVWARRAEAELSRVSPSPADAGALTPTEARVADLVAAGRTNKEVAAALSLSVKTVEANLSRIYGKLDVRSRSELAARLSVGRSSAATR